MGKDLRWNSFMLSSSSSSIWLCYFVWRDVKAAQPLVSKKIWARKLEPYIVYWSIYKKWAGVLERSFWSFVFVCRSSEQKIFLYTMSSLYKLLLYSVQSCNIAVSILNCVFFLFRLKQRRTEEQSSEALCCEVVSKLYQTTTFNHAHFVLSYFESFLKASHTPVELVPRCCVIN